MSATAFFVEFVRLLTPETLLYVLGAGLVGTVVGMLPGLTATMGVALLTGLTYSFPTEQAILILIAVYVGAITGGSRSAILVNIPGTPANAASCLDGYPLTLQGKAAEAIGLSVSASTLGTIVGFVALAVFTPILGDIALRFQSWEFFWVALFGIVICGNLTAPKDPIKGWIAGVLGLMLATVGLEGINAYPRYTLGSQELLAGFALIPVLVGAYGVPEVLGAMREAGVFQIKTDLGRVVPRVRELLRSWKVIVRSGLIGVTIGAIPGVGEDVASWVSYDVSRRTSREPKMYGKGSREGLIAAETANNACVGGAVIPVLTLAIPGSAPAAVLLGAMWLHGIRPGPLLAIEQPYFIASVVAMFLLATLAVMAVNLAGVRAMVKVLMVPRPILMPIIFVLSVIGSYAINARVFDVYVMLGFGVLGYALREMGYPAAPLVLGFILGPMADDNLRRALVLTNGDLTPFFTRPISVVLVALILVVILSRTPVWAAMRRALAGRRAEEVSR